MKRIINICIILLLCVIISGSGKTMDTMEYSYSETDIDLKLSFDKVNFTSSDYELYITISVGNLTDRTLSISPPLIEYYDSCFKLKDNDTNSPLKHDYWEKHGSYIGPPVTFAYEIDSGGTKVFNFNMVRAYNIEEIVSPEVLAISGYFPIISCEEESQGVMDCGPSGEKESNKVRLFVNMENDLVNNSIIVEPHKWNTAWEKEQSDAGVFTVFLGNIDGYSVKDIKQDTVLFNGTLKPVDIKITGSHKDMKGKVMMLKFKKKEGMEYLGIKEPGDIKKINISGQLNDDKWFHAEAEVEIEGAKKKGNK
ncbi:hypothetical protein KAU32_11470 [bacterium]|nr:hypothetical protein [bacterium]